MNRTKKNKHALAGVLALAVLVGGTYAWEAYSQRVTNETVGFDADQGTRLHNDFNGNNADVYVENFASLESGATAYTRVRLYEYMEIGSGAGDLVAPEDKTATLVRGDLLSDSTPDIRDESTWDIYLHEGNRRGDEDIRTYLGLNYGDIQNSNMGAKIYMPTFNRNFDSNVADIKGTLNNLDDRATGDRVGNTPYADYVEYTLGETITDTAIYSRDSLMALDNDGETEYEEIHTAQSTSIGYVISMAEWMDLDFEEQMGNFWVIDTDGWVYWANGLAPQTATSLLVDSIRTVRVPDADYHYGLHVENQSATASGWLEALTEGGDMDMTENAAVFLVDVWDLGVSSYEVTSVTVDTPEENFLYIGDTLELTATVVSPEADDRAKSVVWTIEEVTDETQISTYGSGLTQGQIETTLSSKGVFTPIDGMHSNTYRITATARYDGWKTSSVDISVYDWEQPCVVISVPGNVREVEQTQSLQFSAQVFGLVGQEVDWSLSDSNTVVDGTSLSTTGLLTVDKREPINNVIEIVATSQEDGSIFTVYSVTVFVNLYDQNTAVVTIDPSPASVKQASTQNFSVSIADEDGCQDSQEVTWSLSSSTHATISTSGVLNMKSTATVGAVFYVYADSTIRGITKRGSVEVTVTDGYNHSNATVTLSSTTANIAQAANSTFTASIKDTNNLTTSTSVVWSVVTTATGTTAYSGASVSAGKVTVLATTAVGSVFYVRAQYTVSSVVKYATAKITVTDGYTHSNATVTLSATTQTVTRGTTSGTAITASIADTNGLTTSTAVAWSVVTTATGTTAYSGASVSAGKVTVAQGTAEGAVFYLRAQYTVNSVVKYATAKITVGANTTLFNPNTASVSISGGTTYVTRGTQQSLTATLSTDANGLSASSSSTSWTISSSTFGTVSSAGLLSVASAATRGSNFTVTATITANGVSKSASVSRTVYTAAQMVALSGTTTTVNVNGTDFYVIGYSGTSAVKLLVKTSTGTNSIFGSDNTYSGSTVQAAVSTWYTSWLAAGTLSSSNVWSTGTTTRSTGDPAITTSDSAFLLSYDEANALSSNIRTAGSNYWLRTPYSSGYSDRACSVNSTGVINYYIGYVSYSYAVRPALWIYL